MGDRVSDERLDEMIAILEKWFGIFAIDNTKALKELKGRREAERKAKEEKPEPYDAWWTWTKNKPVKP